MQVKGFRDDSERKGESWYNKITLFQVLYLLHLSPHYLKESYKSGHEMQVLAAANCTNKENAAEANV